MSKLYLVRSVRITCGMSEMVFRATPPQLGEARKYVNFLRKRGKRPILNKMVQIVMGRNIDGSLKLSPLLTEKEFSNRLAKIREKSS